MGSKSKSKTHRQRKPDEQERLLERVLTEAIHADRTLFDSLSDHERELALAVMEDYFSADAEGRKQVTDTLWEIDYIRRPVPVRHFICDEQYIGKSIGSLKEKWIRVLEDITAPGSTIFEVIFGGALGSGKTVAGTVLMAYKIYQFSCLRSPQKFYDLPEASLLAFGIYSITKNQVSNVAYWYLREYIDNSPYFQTYFPRDVKIESKLRFLNQNVQVISGSRSIHSIGSNLYSYLLDEANFFDEKLDKSTNQMTGQAYELYNGTLDRLISRFMRSGLILGSALLISSKTTTTSFTENRLRKLTGLKDVEDFRGPITPPKQDKPTAYYASFSQWDIFPERFKDKRRVIVEVGDTTNKSRLLEPGMKPREEARIVEVPMDLYGRFRDDPDAALRNLAGVGSNAISPFLRDPRHALDAVTDLKNPFPLDSMPICTNNAMDLCDEFDMRGACVIEGGRWRPKLAPDRPRFLHFDLSLTEDATGMSMGFHDGNRHVTRTQDSGAKVTILRPIIRFDFIQRIHAEPNSEIDFDRLFSFGIFLGQFYPIQEITTDSFQARYLIQRFNAAGIRARILSVDRTIGPYNSWRSALRERRFFAPHTEYDETLKRYVHPWFHKEATNLIYDYAAKKVDHPDFFPDGSPGAKDTCDSSAAVVDNIHTYLEKTRGTGETKVATQTHAARRVAGKTAWDELSRNVVTAR